MKFKETSSLTVRSGIGRNPVSKEVITDVASTVIARSQRNIAVVVAVPGVLREN